MVFFERIPYFIPMWRQRLELIFKMTGFLFLFLAIGLVFSEVHKIGFHQITLLIRQTPFHILGLAAFFTALDYLMLSGYDFIALSYIRKKVPCLKVITNALFSFSVTNTTGHAYVAGGSLRYFLYKKINELDIFKMIAFESITFLLGMISVLNIALILAFLTKTTFPYAPFFYIGAVIIDLIFSLYLIFIILKKKSFHIKKIQIIAPTFKQTCLQFLIGTLDICSISLVFYTLLHYHTNCDIIYCFIIFILCQLIGLSTQVPGGLGVFEGSFLYLFSHTPEQKGGIIATLLTFRVLYYFVPLFLSGLFFLIRTLLKK